MADEPSEQLPKRYSSDPRTRALELHREGKFGGSQFGKLGGKRRVERAHQRVSAIAARHAGEVERVLTDALRNGSPSQRLRAAEALLKYWLLADAREVAEVVQPESVSRAELISRPADQLSRPGLTSALLRDELERRADVDGSAIELPSR